MGLKDERFVNVRAFPFLQLPFASATPQSYPSNYILTFPLLQCKRPTTRTCFECGFLCAICAPATTRRCIRCKDTYCILHNTGCDEKTVCGPCDLHRRRLRNSKRKRLMMIEML